MVSDWLDIFESCLGRPIIINSGLDGFKVRILTVIQAEIEEIVISSLETATRKFF